MFVSLQDVQFSVPMESRRDVEKVKDALDLEGTYLDPSILLQYKPSSCSVVPLSLLHIFLPRYSSRYLISGLDPSCIFAAHQAFTEWYATLPTRQ
jgi:hypothetical protein